MRKTLSLAVAIITVFLLLLVMGARATLTNSGSSSSNSQNSSSDSSESTSYNQPPCYNCHLSGSAARDPYDGVGGDGIVRGKHRLGATLVPESSLYTQPEDPPDSGRLFDGQGLDCYHCHTSHNKSKITEAGSAWSSALLSPDPARNGGDANVPNDPERTKTNFCADCHNLDPNWTNPSDNRPNKRSHPINTDSVMKVEGNRKPVASKDVTSCMSCHNASSYDSSNPSDFPHQSVGHKLMSDDYTDPDLPGIDTTDPYRPLPALDKICLKCHQTLFQ